MDASVHYTPHSRSTERELARLRNTRDHREAQERAELSRRVERDRIRAERENAHRDAQTAAEQKRAAILAEKRLARARKQDSNRAAWQAERARRGLAHRPGRVPAALAGSLQ